jgi:hypothetical protein
VPERLPFSSLVELLVAAADEAVDADEAASADEARTAADEAVYADEADEAVVC